jgi:hypothetical protein
MSFQSRLLVGLAFCGLFLASSRVATAQVITATSTTQKNANGSYTITPSGTYSVGAGTWRISYDYVTVNNGVIVNANILVPPGITTINNAPGNGNWTGGGTTILNPIHRLSVRAILQSKNVLGVWTDQQTVYSAPVAFP